MASCSRLRTLVLPLSLSPWLQVEQGENSTLLYSLVSKQGRKQVPGSMVITYVDDSMSTCSRGGPEHGAVAGVCLSVFAALPSELWLGSQTLSGCGDSWGMLCSHRAGQSHPAILGGGPERVYALARARSQDCVSGLNKAISVKTCIL